MEKDDDDKSVNSQSIHANAGIVSLQHPLLLLPPHSHFTLLIGPE